MSTDLFEQLAESDVPPVPEKLEREVHTRVNKELLASQLIDFWFSACAFAAQHFLAALAHWFVLTLTGRPLQAPPARDESQSERDRDPG